MSKPDFVLPRGVAILRTEQGELFEPQEGFIRQESSEPSFTAKYIVSCSGERLGTLIRGLIDACIPSRGYVILCYGKTQASDYEHTYLSPFTATARLVAALDPYWDRLLNDGTVAWGIGWYNEQNHEEIFVDEFKIITVMTSQQSMEDLLHSQGISYVPNLQFVNQHPYALSSLGPGNLLRDNYAREIIKALDMSEE